MSGKDNVVGSIAIMGLGMWIAGIAIYAVVGIFLAFVIGIILAICLVALIVSLFVVGLKKDASHEIRVTLAVFVSMSLVSGVLIFLVRTSGWAVGKPTPFNFLIAIALFEVWVISIINTLGGFYTYTNDPRRREKMPLSLKIDIVLVVLFTSGFVGMWGAPVG